MKGGDCGHCCLGGIFGFKTILETYEDVESRMPEEGGWKRRESMTAYRLKMYLIEKDIPYVEFNPRFKKYKTGLQKVPWDNVQWFEDLKLHINSNHIFMASIRFKKSPPPMREEISSDHMVIINGYREVWRDHKTVKSAKSLIKEIRVSCSATGTYWVEWEYFLYWHGSCEYVIDLSLL